MLRLKAEIAVLFTVFIKMISVNGFPPQKDSMGKETIDLQAGFQEIVVGSSIKGLVWDPLLFNRLKVKWIWLVARLIRFPP